MGLNGRIGKTGDHSQILIFEKESEEKGKKEFLDRCEKRTPLIVESSTYLSAMARLLES